jgi:hypothetical protein
LRRGGGRAAIGDLLEGEALGAADFADTGYHLGGLTVMVRFFPTV